MVIHVLYLSLDVAVNALAVRAVREPPHHAQPVRPLLSGEKLLDGHNDALAAPLPGDAHNLLPQGHLGRTRRAFFGFAPPSLQRSGGVTRGDNTSADRSIMTCFERVFSVSVGV